MAEIAASDGVASISLRLRKALEKYETRREHPLNLNAPTSRSLVPENRRPWNEHPGPSLCATLHRRGEGEPRGHVTPASPAGAAPAAPSRPTSRSDNLAGCWAVARSRSCPAVRSRYARRREQRELRGRDIDVAGAAGGR